MPTTYDGVTAIARDHEHFSSREVGVIANDDDDDQALPTGQEQLARLVVANCPEYAIEIVDST